MGADFLLYGATGFVGGIAAERALDRGLRPLVAARRESDLAARAEGWGCDYRAFELDDTTSLDAALEEVPLVLHCAGPFMYTWRPLVEGCVRTGTHYMDLTGEIPVYEGISAEDEAAGSAGVMLLPGVGFDVVATDCLALHLKRRLPSASRLRLAFQSVGPAGLPPGTVNTLVELLPYGDRVRKDGRVVRPAERSKTREVDFGSGPVSVSRITWGDVFTAYHSTGIPDVEDYVALPRLAAAGLSLLDRARPIFRSRAVRALARRLIPSGSTAEERANTCVHVWAEVRDEYGARASARLHGPEAGVDWTVAAALDAVERVLAGGAEPGYQTPAGAFGPDFALESEGVRREDVV